MRCGYCGAPNRTVRQCNCVRARRYVAANLKGGAAKHPNPPLMPPPPPRLKPRRRSLRRYVCLPQRKPRPPPPPPRRVMTNIRGLPVELYQLRRTLGDAVRDRNVRRLRSDIVDRDGEHCYYLRSRRPRTDVDHAFECQAMGHSLTQCESWHRFYREEAFIDGKVSRHGALRKLCDSVASVQNSLENLHLLDDGLNRSKRHAFSESLDALRAGGQDVDLPHLLTARCVKYADAHLPPAISGERAAANLIRGLRAAEDPLADGLRAFHAPLLADAAAAVVRTYEDLGVA